MALAEVLFRNAQYNEAMDQVNMALSIDTYRPHSNYVAGNIYRATGDYINAMESFGWAARSMEFRSAAFSQMSELALGKGKYSESNQLAGKALDYNKYNITALQVKAIIARKTGDNLRAVNTLSSLLAIDPLNHLAHYELSIHHDDYLLSEHFRSELSDQTYMELAVAYYNKGQEEEAKEILSTIDNTVAKLWLAYLEQTDTAQSARLLAESKTAPIKFVFPYRSETIPVLEWAAKQDTHWKFKYYRGKNRQSEATKLMSSCGADPDDAVFYLTRASMSSIDGSDALQDLQQAMNLSPERWRVWSELIMYHSKKGNYQNWPPKQIKNGLKIITLALHMQNSCSIIRNISRASIN